jgi:DNA helicase-2/ATP-dependent DNA helicase PcrA
MTNHPRRKKLAIPDLSNVSTRGGHSWSQGSRGLPSDPLKWEVLEGEPAWSEQQQTFLDWCKHGKGSCVLEAVAGAGKTTVLMAGVRRLSGTVALMAFNKDIADELSARLTKMEIGWQRAVAKTVHGFGFAALRKGLGGNVRVDGNKLRALLDGMVGEGHSLAQYRGGMIKLVSLAKQSLFGVLEHQLIEDEGLWIETADYFDVFDDPRGGGQVPFGELVPLCRRLLEVSNQKLDVVDFDDMIYLPLLLKMDFWKYDNILVDEAADTNAARRALVRAMLKKGGRVIAVGDRHQAIYGFTGADNDAMDLIAEDFGCVHLPLTITYRCPRRVVDFARQWVSHITAAETAPEGEVSSCSLEQFLSYSDLTAGTAVLCRLNKPLVKLAFQLIRKRVPCRIEGRDSVGKGIVRLMQRWKVKSLDALEGKLEEHLRRETTKLTAKKQEEKLAVVEDMVETVQVILDQCRSEGKHTVDEAAAYVDSLFGDKVKDRLVLSSIHRAKGREFRRVFWLDRAGTCPSKWARSSWQQAQEVNLQYVAATRAMDRLIDIVVEGER